MIPTLEQVDSTLIQLKARRFEIEQETKIVTSRIAFYSGQLEILKAHEENIKDVTKTEDFILSYSGG